MAVEIQSSSAAVSAIDRRIRLADGVHRLGLICDAAGAFLAAAPLRRRTPSGFEPRPSAEIETLIKAAYGDGVDPAEVSRGLEVIATALNHADVGRAQIAAVRLRAPELSGEAAACVTQAQLTLAKYDFNSGEARDWHGRWTTGDGAPEASGPSNPTPPVDGDGADKPTSEVNPNTLTPAAYQGYFHDEVVANYAAYLRSKGEIVATEVKLQMADGGVYARIDLLAFDPVTRLLYGVEVKTGDRPFFTPSQMIVYPHAMLGGSVVAPETKALALGVLPDIPLEPLPIWLVFQRNRETDPIAKWANPMNMSKYYRGEVSHASRSEWGLLLPSWRNSL